MEAIFWPRSTARRALSGLARRRFKTAVNAAILEEYSAITAEVRARIGGGTKFLHNRDVSKRGVSALPPVAL